MESFFEYEESQHSVQEVWDDPETIFVVDTNIFLNIYVFHQETRQAIYEALDKIKGRLWSPHQVMLEFHRARERHIDKNKRYFQSDFIDGFLKQFTNPYKKLQDLKNQYRKNYSDLGEIIDSFTKDAEKEFSESFTKLHKSFKEKLIPIEQKLAELQSQLITSKDQDSLYQKLCGFILMIKLVSHLHDQNWTNFIKKENCVFDMVCLQVIKIKGKMKFIIIEGLYITLNLEI